MRFRAISCVILMGSSLVSAAEPKWGAWSLLDRASLPSNARVSESIRFDAQEGALLDGKSGGISVPLPSTGVDPARFTLHASVKTEADLRDDLGSIISLWDPARRTGWHLSLRNNSGCTSSQANWRQLEFGMDAGTEPEWRDEGRPGQSILGFAICAHDDHLYVATCEGGAAGHVYRYRGTGDWQDLGTLDGSNSVTALAAHGGKLYAGTGKYRLRGSSLVESENETLGGRIYRLDDGDRWTLVGELPETEAIAAVTVFGGKLYASSLYQPAGFFRLDDDGRWTKIPTPDNKRVQAMRVHDGWLYASSYDGGRVYRYDGEAWEDLGNLADNTQTYSFAGYQGKLWVGTWRSGKVYEWQEPNWIDRGQLGQELEVMAMGVYNGAMYAGSLPLAEVYRYDGGESWQRLKQIDETPDVTYRRVWSMANYRGRAFYTTLPTGNIWSMSTGACATWDRELSPGWHDLKVERTAEKVMLSVDGKEVASRSTGELSLPKLESPMVLQIGDGPNGTFNGRIRNVRVE